MKSYSENMQYQSWRQREEVRRQEERWQEQKEQEARFQIELEERADGKPFWLWKRPWEC